MTREEKIEILEKEKAYMIAHGGDRQAEALTSAIKVLEQEPSEDAISRQAVLKAMCDASIPIIYKGKPSFVVDYVGVIETVPLVNPKETKTDSWSIKDVADTLARHGLIVAQEPKTGHWVLSGGYWRCSNCNEKVLLKLDKSKGNCKEYMPIKSNYCPNCGAKMVEE